VILAPAPALTPAAVAPTGTGVHCSSRLNFEGTAQGNETKAGNKVLAKRVIGRDEDPKCVACLSHRRAGRGLSGDWLS
jgi:hypothetical protein